MTSIRSIRSEPRNLIDVCPWCEQPIPHERFAEIHGRIQANERAQTRAIELRLQEELDLKLAQIQASADAKVQQVKADAAHALGRAQEAARVAEIAAREEAKRQAEAAAAAKLKAAEKAKARAEKQLGEQKAREEEALNAGLQEQREALEQHALTLVNAEKAKAFSDGQKLEGQLDLLKRQLQKKTTQELGEGAEVNLFEELKREFPGDDIKRVKKGEAGADIVHKIIENGRECGSIVYDSKNRTAWRNDYVTKLRADQVAAKADHAILVGRVFPAGAAQLHIQGGVIVANPARVVALIRLIRNHQTHLATLRLSDQARTEKMAGLYHFITSERCRQLLSEFETVATSLLELDVKEKKAHDATWKRRGELVRALEQTQGTLVTEIDLIVTAPVAQLRKAT
jgi:hypothetical protein